MSFNLAVILGDNARSASGKPLALFRSELRKKTLGTVLKEQLVPAKAANSAAGREAG